MKLIDIYNYIDISLDCKIYYYNNEESIFEGKISKIPWMYLVKEFNTSFDRKAILFKNNYVIFYIKEEK